MAEKKKKKRTLPLAEGGVLKLPLDALEALELSTGDEVEIVVDTRRKQIRLERHVEDPWAEAMRQKKEKDLEDLMGEQAKRDEEANKLFDAKLKEPPPKRKPEDDPNLWR